MHGGRGDRSRGSRDDPGTATLTRIYFVIALSKAGRLRIFLSFYYRDILINSLSLRVLVCFPPSPALRSPQVWPCVAPRPPGLVRSSERVALDTAALPQAPPPSSGFAAIKRVYYETWRPSPPVTRRAGAEALGRRTGKGTALPLPPHDPDQRRCEGA